MKGTEIIFGCFTQNEALGIDWLAFSGLVFFGLDFRRLIWMMCVCHGALFGFGVLFVESKTCEKAQDEGKRCFLSTCSVKQGRQRRQERLTRPVLLHDNQDAKECESFPLTLSP